MKKLIILALFIVGLTTFTMGQNTILEGRNMPIGSTVTLRGIVTNGAELGIIRYFQDNTAGMAAYGSLVNPIALGDSVTITGALKNYNQLLEIDPITSVVIRSSGNPVPAPIVLTPAQLNETYESRLVRVNGVTFIEGGGIFAGNKLYQFTANGQAGFIYVRVGQNDIIGKPIPSSPVNLTAILSQFHFSNPAAGYQLLPRTIADIQIANPIFFTSTLNNTAFTQTSFDFNWVTNVAGTSEIFYGLSAEGVRANHKKVGTTTTNHQISISGYTPGQIAWVRAFSVLGSDTAFSGIVPFATISSSSGNMKVYFNTASDFFYSTGVNAVQLFESMDDTLIAYINRAKHTIDFTMYNFNNTGLSNMSNALKAAANRGVLVRVIGCGTTANLGINELVGSNVNVFIGPSSTGRTGIMHNKFIIFDSESTNPNDPLVWTGSTNLTEGQINLDANNVIIIQDQSLARAYKIEFEEMWGSTTATHNPSKAKFGNTKSNNTPHEFIIGGKRVESYFSPTDGVNAKIVQTINTAENDLSIATMLITRNDMADAIAARNAAGVKANVITNAEGNNGATVNTVLKAALGVHYTFDNVSPGTLHHKYMVVDQAALASDPLTLTGSHNWSAAADNDNDENTLIIHDATIANIHYQNFVKRFVENNGVLFELTGPPTARKDSVGTPVNTLVTVQVLANDTYQAPVTLSIESTALKGTAYIPFNNPNVISYLPNNNALGRDVITYKIAYIAAPQLFATSTIIFQIGGPDGINENANNNRLQVQPNPVVNGNVTVSCAITSPEEGSLQVHDIAGKLIYERKVALAAGENKLILSLPETLKGLYLMSLTTSKATWNQKVMFK